MARYIKLNPHQLLSEYEIAIWTDANITLKTGTKKYIDLLEKDNSSLGMIKHPIRDCFYKEADECIARKRDDPKTIEKQKKYYREQNIPEKGGMFETNFMIIKLNKKSVKNFFQTWW